MVIAVIQLFVKLWSDSLEKHLLEALDIKVPEATQRDDSSHTERIMIDPSSVDHEDVAEI